MKRCTALLLGLCLSLAQASTDELNADAREYVSGLRQAMSLKHKIGQMVQLNIDVLLDHDALTLNTTKLEALVREWSPGSLLNSPFSNGEMQGKTAWDVDEWKSITDEIQSAYLHTAGGAGVRMMFGIDSVHGAIYVKGATVFPQQINAGASFNRDLAQRMGQVTAKDTRAAGMHWAFSPILGIATQPAWPRVFETFGEDPLLAGELGAALITGLQGPPPSLCSPARVAACMKHFVGYPNPRSGHDRSPEWIPDRQLYQYYTPAFYAAIKAGVATAMESVPPCYLASSPSPLSLFDVRVVSPVSRLPGSSRSSGGNQLGHLKYNELNGVPMVTSAQYLKRLLRDTLGFDGMTITDWREVVNLKDWHMTAPTARDAVRLSMQRTSIDMSMVPYDMSFAEELHALVLSGQVPEARVDAAVDRVLALKYKLGLLPQSPSCHQEGSSASRAPGHPDDRAEALQLVRESVVLLRNEDHLLPLTDASGLSTILVTGPTADSLSYQSGGWTFHWQGPLNDVEFPFGSTVLEGIRAQAAKLTGSVNVRYEPGCGVDDDTCDAATLATVLDAARAADVVIACMGEKNYAEKPGNIDDLSMAGAQRQMLAALGQQDHTPVVLLLVEGRPRVMHGAADGIAAVLHAFLPGPEGGVGIAEILFGLVNPSARMPLSYPKMVNNAPIQYWRGPTEDEAKFEFEFGAGLGYSTMVYSNLKLSSSSLRPGQAVSATVTVTNTGARAGKEPVLLFVSDRFRVTLPEVKMLKGFHKTDELQPGQSVQVAFSLTCDQLAFVGVELTWVVEPGEFTVAVGGLEATLTLLPQSDVEVHAGDTIPWAMWGQPAGHQLPLPVDLDQYVEEHTPRSTPSDDSHGEVHEATIVVHGSSAGRDAGMMLGGMALGAVCAGGAWLAFTRFKRAQQVKAQSLYLEMGDAFTIDDATSAIAPPPPEGKYEDDGPATIDVNPL